jgi:hypothetical protein
MNVEIGTEAALFPEKEYINGIAFASPKIYEKNKLLSQDITGGIFRIISASTAGSESGISLRRLARLVTTKETTNTT